MAAERSAAGGRAGAVSESAVPTANRRVGVWIIAAVVGVAVSVAASSVLARVGVGAMFDYGPDLLGIMGGTLVAGRIARVHGAGWLGVFGLVFIIQVILTIALVAWAMSTYG